MNNRFVHIKNMNYKNVFRVYNVYASNEMIDPECDNCELVVNWAAFTVDGQT